MKTKTINLLLSFFLIVGLISGGVLYYNHTKDLPENPDFTFPDAEVRMSIVLPEGGDEAIKNAIDLYRRKHSNVFIDYRPYARDNYQSVLRQQLLTSTPPDIFALKNDYADILGERISSTSALTSGGLALYANKKLLKEAGVKIPTNWEETLTAVTKLVKKDGNNIQEAGLALGAYNNIDQAGDILAFLMIQNGAKITSADKQRALFAEPETPSYFPGTEALKFYTAFSNPSKDIYSWNSIQPRSGQAFIDGKVALVISGPDLVHKIKKSTPSLEFETVKVPKIEGREETTVSSFWLLGVSNQTNYPDVAKDFVKFFSNYKNSLNFANEAKLPSHREDILKIQKNSKEFRGLVESADIAVEIYKKNPDSFELIMRNMIRRVQLGENAQKVVDQAAKEFTELLQAGSGADSP